MPRMSTHHDGTPPCAIVHAHARFITAPLAAAAGRARAAATFNFGQACAAAGPPRPGQAAATFDFGWARHRADTRLRTREPVRAEIVLGRQAGGPDHWPGCQPTPQGQWGGLGGSVPTPRELNVSAS